MELRDDSRPLTARSIVASTLLGVRPPRLPVRSLVASASLFNVAEGTVRTALSRMVAAGELVVDEGQYALAGAFLARRERQDESRSGATRPWSGEWEVSVVEGGRRIAADRTALRKAMRDLRRAELREGVWLRPDNLDPRRLLEARSVVAGQCVTFTGRPDPELAVRLWDLQGWAEQAEGLITELTAHGHRLAAEGALAPGFVLSAAVLRHLQADPLLPTDVLGPTWPGPRLRAAYETYDTAFQSAWTTRLRTAA